MPWPAHRSRLFASLFAAFFCLCLAVALPASAADEALLRAVDGAQAALDHDLVVRSTTGSSDADVLVVELAPGETASSLRSATNDDANVLSVEPVEPAWVQAADLAAAGIVANEDLAGTRATKGRSGTPCLDAHLAEQPWSGWTEQYATTLLKIAEAQSVAGHCGEGVVVAIIDTGVDAEHPLLAGAVVEGYDFLLEVSSLSAEWSNLDNSFSAIVENSFSAIVENSFSAIVEGSSIALQMDSMAVFLAEEDTQTIEDLDLPPLFGHGTMVAGLVRMVAPGAQILPLRTFDGHGVGQSDDVVRAIYYAVDHGADVINMSFSMESYSTEIAEALRYARANGVVTVAAAGNQGQRTLIYPASNPGAVGVSASDALDAKAVFSNYGAQVADLASPGVAVVSSFPGAHYAAGWGTSFSTPLVSGTAALLLHGATDDASAHDAAVQDLLSGVTLVNGMQDEVLSNGRLDVLGAVNLSLE